MTFCQCLLLKGKTSQLAWLPEKFAVQGKYVRLLEDNGWMVDKVYPNRITEQFLFEYKDRQFKNQRKVTDI